MRFSRGCSSFVTGEFCCIVEGIFSFFDPQCGHNVGGMRFRVCLAMCDMFVHVCACGGGGGWLLVPTVSRLVC